MGDTVTIRTFGDISVAHFGQDRSFSSADGEMLENIALELGISRAADEEDESLRTRCLTKLKGGI
jgi:hypothetical protein